MGKHKSRKPRGSSTWACGICGKTFISEHYIDLHLERKHSDNGTEKEEFCLADYCDMFDVCDVDNKRRRAAKGAQEKCNATNLNRTRDLCDKAIQKCFPLDSPISRNLHGQMSRHFCRTLDCEIREERRKHEDE